MGRLRERVVWRCVDAWRCMCGERQQARSVIERMSLRFGAAASSQVRGACRAMLRRWPGAARPLLGSQEPLVRVRRGALARGHSSRPAPHQKLRGDAPGAVWPRAVAYKARVSLSCLRKKFKERRLPVRSLPPSNRAGTQPDDSGVSVRGVIDDRPCGWEPSERRGVSKF